MSERSVDDIKDDLAFDLRHLGGVTFSMKIVSTLEELIRSAVKDVLAELYFAAKGNK